MTEKSEKSGMPVKHELLLESGVHIGTKIRTNDMRQYIFKRRDDGLYILDLRKSAERLIEAAKIMAKYRPEEVTVVASRVYSSNPAAKFAELTGVNIIKGRFVPGTMTNMKVSAFMEPKLLFVCDPKGEHEALVESAKNGVPVIALCDTDNETKFIDLVVPINNKGKRSLALIFYVLSREIMLAQGKIKSYDEFTKDINYFEQMTFKTEEKTNVAEQAVQVSPNTETEQPVQEVKRSDEPKTEKAPEQKSEEQKTESDGKKEEAEKTKKGHDKET